MHVAELACTHFLSLSLHGAYSVHLSFTFQPAIFFLKCVYFLWFWVMGPRLVTSVLAAHCIYLLIHVDLGSEYQ